MEVPREKLRLEEDERLLSPPWIVAPYACATVVNVQGFVPHALLDVRVNGGDVVTGFDGGFPEPKGAVVPLPGPLIAGQTVSVRQRLVAAESDWSPEVDVRDHTQDYPAGPPRPEINPAPVYQCGARTGVSNLLTGSTVWITAQATEVGRVEGATQHQGVNVTPDYGLAQEVIGWASLCDDPSPPSATETSQPPPLPLAALTFEPTYDGSEQVTLNGLANGARFTLSRNGNPVGTFAGWGGRFTVNGIFPAVSTTDTFSATQMLCPGDPASPPGSTTPLPCSALPAPVVAPIQAGDDAVFLIQFVPDARTKVYVNGVKRGDSGGSIILLTQPVDHGDVVHVIQSVGICVSNWAQELRAQCVAPHVGPDPVAFNLFPIGWKEYDGGETDVLGMTQHRRGSVYYPADLDGDGTPFNARLAALGRVPIVFMIHGQHSDQVANYQGYEYFQRQLARAGIVAVSVDENEAYPRSSASNIFERAQLLIRSIEYFQSLDAGGDSVFGGRIDFTRVGLMGHSRGGEAVCVVPEFPPPAGITILGVLALDPTLWGAFSGRPAGYAYLTILPAANGDVVTNTGARFYDQAVPDPFKSQLYVDHANHNYFNTVWTNDDAGGAFTLMAPGDHQRILSAYGCAFFRRLLLGHDTVGYLAGTVLPPFVLTANVHISFDRPGGRVVDNHEDGNGIDFNSLNLGTMQSGGLTADEHGFSQDASNRFNDSFLGNTVGMVARSEEAGGSFRSPVDPPAELMDGEVWVRAAEVSEGSIPAGSTGFELGLETDAGTFWVDSNDVGGLPRPFDRLGNWPDKTMLTTLRFPLACFIHQSQKERLVVRAILLRLNRSDRRAIAFDDLEIFG